MIGTGNFAGIVNGNNEFGGYIQKSRRLPQTHQPMAAVRLNQRGGFNQRGKMLHQMQHAVLALPLGQGGEGRHIKHGAQAVLRIKHRCGGAAQADVGGVEMVGAVHDGGLAGGRYHGHGAGAVGTLAPQRAGVQPRLPEIAHLIFSAKCFHHHAVGIGQQHHIAHVADLPGQHLQAVAGHGVEAVHGIHVLGQIVLRQNQRLLHHFGIEAVLVHAALPRFDNSGLEGSSRAAGVAVNMRQHVPDMLGLMGLHIAYAPCGFRLALSLNVCRNYCDCVNLISAEGLRSRAAKRCRGKHDAGLS